MAFPTWPPGRQRLDEWTDFNDLVRSVGFAEVRECIERAKTPDKREEREARPANADLVDKIEAAIARLAALSETAYETVRKDEATDLKVEVSYLDLRVKEARKANAVAPAPAKGSKPSVISTLDPWPEAIDGGELLEELTAAFKKHVIMTDEEALTASLWVLHAHTYNAAEISPILMIRSAEKRCGKTTVMKILKWLTPESLMASNLTASSVFRVVDQWHPTLIVDEADTFLKNSEDLRGVLNSGHDREGAFIIRAVGTFSTWAPKAISLIGAPPDTLDDRSVTIKLRRKLMSEKVTSLQGRAQEIKNLGRKGARWAADNLESLCKRDALVPDKIINDRAADNWRSLLNIADQIGGEWPEKARRAALAMEGARQDAEPDTESRRLLADIRSVFRNHKFEKGEPEALKIAELIAGLNLAESPWRSYNRGKPISEIQFGRLLSPYGIQSEVRREPPVTPGGEAPPRGRKWYKDSFQDTWNRYLPPEEAGNPCDTRTTLKDKENLPVTESRTGNPVTGENYCDFNGVTPDTGFCTPSGSDIYVSGDSDDFSPSPDDGRGSDSGEIVGSEP